MLATKNNLQLRQGMTRREAVNYHMTVGREDTEVNVDAANKIKSQRKKPAK